MIDPRDPALNYVVVNGVQSPGKAEITGADVQYVWDVKQAYGMTGAYTVYRGRAPVEFTLTITLWKPEHFLAWPLFAKLLEPPKPGIKLVVGMAHPILSAADVKAVAIKKLGQLTRDMSSGLWRSVTQCLEYRPLVPALVKPRGAIPAVSKGAGVPAKTEADKALEQARQDFVTARAAAQ